MKALKIFFASIIINLLCTTPAFASEIILDGNFSDWNNKVGLTDVAGDSSNSDEDLKSMKYYSDGQTLYFYFERYDLTNPYWDIQLIFFNGTGHLGSHYTPWDNPKDSFNWKNIMATTVTVNVSKSRTSSNKPKITTNLGGSFDSSSQDGREIEFSIPLKSIGLVDKEIQFAAKSDPSAYAPNIDWIPENGPIIIVDGPIFGNLSFIFIILIFLFIGNLSIINLKKQRNIV
ncbi:hypothetical protein [uncultured Clostridium sp.]|jgi:hypothetical protein|uniref:hypothetical protein n=1 Tax=uncultured Clostridium sp. TaxID=59620 RepID=UPI00262B4B1B|nr:hypothetical protein [uncultured Clostridium sp.]